MADIIFNCSSSGNDNIKRNGRVRVTYEAGNGEITITKLEGNRNDGYTSVGQTKALTITCGGVSISSNTANVHTLQSYGWKDWGSLGNTYHFTNLNGEVSVTISAGQIGETGYSTTFAGTINAGSPPTPVDPAPTNVTIAPTLTESNTVINLHRSADGTVTNWEYKVDDRQWIPNHSFYDDEITVNDDLVSGLKPNTSYTFQVQAKNNNSSYASSGIETLITAGDNPVIGNISVSCLSDRCSFPTSEGITYDYNASYYESRISYGIHNSGSMSTVTGPFLYGLSSNTEYDYTYQIWDNFGRASNIKSGSFTTPSNPPEIRMQMGIPKVGGVQFQIGAVVGPGDSPITQFGVGYRKKGTSDAFTEVTSATYTIDVNNLEKDIEIEYYVSATNTGGTTRYPTSGILTTHTKMANPVITVEATDTTKSEIIVVVQTTTDPTRNVRYNYSSDDGITWSEETNNRYETFFNLQEDTLYPIKVRATAKSNISEDYDTVSELSIPLRTLSTQATIRMKINNTWVKGKLYCKINNTWVPAKKVYIKRNNTWVIGKNN